MLAYLPIVVWLAFGASYLYVCWIACQRGRTLLHEAPYAGEVWQVKAALWSGIGIVQLALGVLLFFAARAVASWF